MSRISQSPTDPAFVQNPYDFYARQRASGPMHDWDEYHMPAVFDYDTVNALLRDRRFGRDCPEELKTPVAPHIEDFHQVEKYSMLSLDGAPHMRMRALTLRAFTSRRIARLEPDIIEISNALIDAFPSGPFDLIPAYATQVPVIIICRLLGVPEAMAPQLLEWSNTMVAMYQARRDRQIEDAAARAATEFADYIRAYAEEKRKHPADDLITELLAAEEAGEKLTMDELIGTCIVLLNAGHEATVHTIGNGVVGLLNHGHAGQWLTPERVDATVEEVLRHDPPLHIFTRYAFEEAEVLGRTFKRGDQIALMLGAANRDPKVWDNPEAFDPSRPIKTNTSFGAGAHFCIGAPLARLELRHTLPILFQRCPNLKLEGTPEYADLYHFHGLDHLMVSAR
ncbi:cytochrome P450 [Pseudooceanicola spongiae]|uniref:Cytochrome P450 n=1 Tax=Pseudooceanicola spongiae TaxID=2613965 RepID=A0A7L9WLJ5_9RHOB|nr:cytochrome P450 [Pseudooceanicola spongiae]QOL80577.1 cytochrome P450 [Pseudooceanicola spongiae]